MASIRHILIAIFFLGQITCLQAQVDNLGFERIGADQGLPNCIIKEIVEDRFGFLWLATCEGLFRYDGYEYKAYRHDVTDSTSLSNPSVRSLLEDQDGNLWVGTIDGLNLLDRRTGKFQLFKPSPEETDTKVLNQVWKILEDSRGNMWIASNKSAFKFDKQSKQFSKVKLKGQAQTDYIVRDFIEDRQGIIWAGTTYGLLKLSPGDTSFQLVLPDPNPKSKYNQEIRCFLEEADHAFLLGTEGGLVRWNRKDNTIEKSFLPKDLENLSVSQLMKDSKGNKIFWCRCRIPDHRIVERRFGRLFCHFDFAYRRVIG